MKIIPISDLHGYLPEIKDKVDIVCICGDIFPLDVQSDMLMSFSWFNRKFIPWCMKLHCDKVILIGGNHDFMYYKLVNYKKLFAINDLYSDREILNSTLDLPEKIVYLQDECYSYKGKTFYGSPWTPNLMKWAFYKGSSEIKEKFNKIPNKLDVLLTHVPGKNLFETGASHINYGNEVYVHEYGCSEIVPIVKKRDIKWWFFGHIHTGNHDICTMDNGTKIMNCSLKEEDYNPVFEHKVIEL